MANKKTIGTFTYIDIKSSLETAIIHVMKKENVSLLQATFIVRSLVSEASDSVKDMILERQK